MSFHLVYFTWDEKERVMRPLPRFHNVLGQYKDGEVYPLQVREQRSSAQHAHYFASVNAAWKNLRGQTAEILSTPTHLRGWALIQAGWCDQHVVHAPSKDDAIRMATFARKLASDEGYVEIKVVKVDGEWFVQSRMPRSQSRASMDKDEFTRSSRDVLEILAGTIEVTRKSLEQEGRRGDG